LLGKVNQFNTQKTTQASTDFVNLCLDNTEGIYKVMSELRTFVTNSQMTTVITQCTRYKRPALMNFLQYLSSLTRRIQLIYMSCALAADSLPSVNMKEYGKEMSGVLEYYKIWAMNKFMFGSDLFSINSVITLQLESFTCVTNEFAGYLIDTRITDQLNQDYGYWTWSFYYGGLGSTYWNGVNGGFADYSPTNMYWNGTAYVFKNQSQSINCGSIHYKTNCRTRLSYFINEQEYIQNMANRSAVIKRYSDQYVIPALLKM
jgi:hypothetical protein